MTRVRVEAAIEYAIALRSARKIGNSGRSGIV
jgi:hypothetical protein